MKIVSLFLFLLLSFECFASIPKAIIELNGKSGDFLKTLNGKVVTHEVGACQISIQEEKLKIINIHSKVEVDFEDYFVTVLRDIENLDHTSYNYLIKSLNPSLFAKNDFCKFKETLIYNQEVVKTGKTIIVQETFVCSDSKRFVSSELCMIEESKTN